jgi:hypothetical protein
MARAENTGEIRRFDPNEWGAERLRDEGKLLVAILRPEAVLSPDSGAFGLSAVDADGNLAPMQAGLISGEADPRITAGRLMKRVAIDAGLAPGYGVGLTNAGIRRGPIEIMATPLAKEKIRARTGDTRGYLGYFALVDRKHYGERTVFDTPASRETMQVEANYGVTLEDAERLIGVGVLGVSGLDGLRQQSEHPVVRQQHEDLGLPLYGLNAQ